MIDSSGFNQMMTKFKDMKIYKYFDNIDIFKHLIFHIDDFKPIKNIKKLEPLYIKKAI
jgi:hypothetical protein